MSRGRYKKASSDEDSISKIADDLFGTAKKSTYTSGLKRSLGVSSNPKGQLMSAIGIKGFTLKGLLRSLLK